MLDTHRRQPSPANRRAELLIWLAAAALWGASTVLVYLLILRKEMREPLYLLGGMAASWYLLGLIMQLASVKSRDALFQVLDACRERGWAALFAQFRKLQRDLDYVTPNSFPRAINLQSFVMSYGGPILVVPLYFLTTVALLVGQLLR